MGRFSGIRASACLVCVYYAYGIRKDILIDGVPGGLMAMSTGVDKGPFCTAVPVNFTLDLREVGSTFIRTHDAQTLDWDVQFPFPRLDADPDDPSNYNFTLGDATMLAILDNAFTPYLRLGNSWNHPAWSAAPANVTVLARVLLNTVRHYNDGWGGGPFTTRRVRWIELWNEPDGGPGPNQFWNLSASTFYELVDTTARLLKSYDPSLIIGTPAVAGALSPGIAPYVGGLLSFLGSQQTPVDFYSWHNYGSVDGSWPPYAFLQIGNFVRAQLAKAGLAHLFHALTEWNVCIECPMQDTAAGAAFAASSLTYQLDAGVALSIFYPGCDANWGLFNDIPLGTGHVSWRPLTYAMQFFNQLLALAPARLGAVTAPPELNYTVLAGTTELGASGLAATGILISALSSTTDGYDVTLGASPGSSWRMVTRLIDDAHNGTIIDNVTVVVSNEGAIQFSQTLPAPFVAFVTLTQLE